MAKNLKLPLKHSLWCVLCLTSCDYCQTFRHTWLGTVWLPIYVLATGGVVNVAKNVKLPLKYSFVVCVVAIVLLFVTHKAFLNFKCGYC